MGFKLYLQSADDERRVSVTSDSKHSVLKRVLVDIRFLLQAVLIQSNLTPFRYLQAVAIVLSMAVIITGMGSKLGWFASKDNGIVVNADAPQVAEKQEVEFVTVRRFGFEPASITRPAKGFLLTFANRSNQPVLDLSLDRLEGNTPVAKLSQMKLKRGQGYSANYLNLPPGEYELRESNHPDWKCKITVTPR